jgi:hypothetical protein
MTKRVSKPFEVQNVCAELRTMRQLLHFQLSQPTLHERFQAIPSARSLPLMSVCCLTEHKNFVQWPPSQVPR